MRKISLGLSILLLVAILGFGAAFTSPVSAADSGTDVFQGVCHTSAASSSVCKDRVNGMQDPSNPNGAGNPLAGKDGILMKVTRIIAVVAGVVAVIILIVTGLSMITSNGDSQKVTKARNGFIYALVGLVIIVLAQAIVSFVVSKSL